MDNEKSNILKLLIKGIIIALIVILIMFIGIYNYPLMHESLLELTWDDEGVVSVVPGEDMKELRIVIDGEPLWNWRPDNGT